MTDKGMREGTNLKGLEIQPRSVLNHVMQMFLLQTSDACSRARQLPAILLLLWLVLGKAHAEDWPTVSLNAQRNAFSSERVDPARLEAAWTYRSSNPPSPAWHGPAKWDAYNDVRMHSMRNYDAVFQPIAAGKDVFFGSSVDDSVTCLDSASGEEKWSFCTDGPIRIAPTFSAGNLYFGSDDGYAYCIRAADGELVWKFQPRHPERQVLNNGRFIPLLPIRSGVTVYDGVAYFAASLLPWKESYLCAVDAETGKAKGTNLFVRELDNMTFEGPLAISPNLLIAPQGRVPPVLFSRRSGKQLGALDGGGGSFVVVLPDSKVVHGPGSKAGEVNFSSTESREKLATHNNARALVLNDEHTFILAKTSIAAIDKLTSKETWRTPCVDGLSLIGVGNTLFVGKPDRVEAYSTEDGTLQWASSIEGKAFGLSFAQNKLLVSTDLGVIYAFAPTATESLAIATVPKQEVPTQSLDTAKLAEIKNKAGKGLTGRWVFQTPFVRGFSTENLAGGLPASIDGTFEAVRVGKHTAIVMSESDTSITISKDHKEAKLPTSQLTAEAWVRIDKPQPWGAIIGAFQDNGNDEHGWLLGYRESKFCVGLAGQNGNGRITYLTAKDKFTVGRWHHVAGTYDGEVMRLFVDGKLAASSQEQRGPIRYASEGPYVIGAYRDKDENFPLNGMIHEVSVYERALPVEELRKHYRLKAKRFPPPAPPEKKPKTYEVAVGPWLQFTKPGEAVVRWQTEKPTATKLEYHLGDEVKQYEEAKKTTNHEVRLSSLKRNQLYHYTIEFVVDGKSVKTPGYECDTFFNYGLLNVDAESQADSSEELSFGQAAGSILAQSQIRQGLCLDWNAGSCRLAEELVRQSQLRVLCLCSDPEAASAARKRFRSLGLYGSRVVVRYAEDFDQLSLTSHWANLIVSESTLTNGEPPASVDRIRKMLAPTGKAVLGAISIEQDSPKQGAPGATSQLGDWAKRQELDLELLKNSAGQWVTLGGLPFEGAGEWPYIYGGAHNAAYGGESLAGAKTSDDLKIQWLGRPGPRYQADRSGRKTPPLSFGGRLFLEGLHRIVSLDIYNGTVLWSLELPNFERFNIPRDTSNWCGDGGSLFAAVRNRCWRINAQDGEVTQMYTLPNPKPGKGEYDWGYVASAEDTLIGSAVKRGAFYTNFWGGAGWYDAAKGPETYKVCSDAIFGFDKQSGKRRWTHAQGLVINSTITMSDNRLFFVEGRNKNLLTVSTRRLNSPDLWREQYLVALNTTTGEIDWEVPLDTVDGKVVFYMAHDAGRLIIVSSDKGKYHVYAIKDDSGSPLWNVVCPWGADGKADHGSHLSRPAIVGSKLFVRPSVIDIATGQIREERIPEGKCGTYCCTDNALFFRGNPGARFAMWSTIDNQYSQWDRLRPDCWLSSIPAGGMLLSPEGGGGCSCGSWMETSIGFIPTARLSQ